MTLLATPVNRMLLAGEWVGARRSMEVRNPESGALVGVVPSAQPEHAEQALRAAFDTRHAARALPVHERQRILQRAAEAVEADAEPFARLIATEGIKTLREARAEVGRAAMTLRLCAQEAGRLEGETLDFGQRPGSAGRSGHFTRQPLGVVLAITPYNDPLNLVAHKVGPAIASGNAVILKPHEQTPLCALLLAGVLLDAGLPAATLQVLTGEGAVIGDALVADARVQMVSFTGGPGTGARIARVAGMKKLAMEVGGNCATLVLHDADIAAAVAACVSGAYAAAGQNCLHVQRLFVHARVHDEFRERFVEATRRLVTGAKLDEATDMGCQVHVQAATRIEQWLDSARAVGARVLAGGTRTGSVVAPTLIERVPATHPLMRDEVFGPVTCLAPFDSLDEAIARANDVAHGLQAAVFTADLHAALDAVDQLEAGAVMVNDSTDYRMDAMPFGGTKASGFGREGVRWAMQEMTQPKVVCFNRVPARPPMAHVLLNPLTAGVIS